MSATRRPRTIFHQDGLLLSPRDIVLVNGFNDAPADPISQFAVFNAGTWKQFEIDTDHMVSVAISASPCIYAIGRNGLFLRVKLPIPTDWDGIAAAMQFDIIPEAHKFGDLTRCRGVGDAAFAIGQCGQVYRLAEDGFQEYSFGLRSLDGWSLEDIGGTSDSVLYACGMGGVVIKFDGKRWERLDTPTNRNLSSVLVEHQDSVYFGGDAGTLLHLKDGAWDVCTGNPDRNYWDICTYRGSPVLAHSSGIDRYDGQSLVPLEHAPASENTFYRLFSAGDYLLSTGPDDLFVIDPQDARAVAVPGCP